MAKPSNLAKIVCLLDSDVVLNWLTQEEDPIGGFILWDAPHKIMRLIENGTVQGSTTLVNLMEIRFVLRRKKIPEATIKNLLTKLLSLIKVIIPDEINLLEANGLQETHSLSPFDAVILGVVCAMKDQGALFISRDKEFLKIAKNFVPSMPPEEFLKRIK
jgi:predicted nucleic acid-binding protein